MHLGLRCILLNALRYEQFLLETSKEIGKYGNIQHNPEYTPPQNTHMCILTDCGEWCKNFEILKAINSQYRQEYD